MRLGDERHGQPEKGLCFPVKVFWMKASAGLGNRLTALAYGINFCKHSGRELFVDWTDPTYSSDGHNTFNDCFHLVGVPMTGRPTENLDDVSPELWKGRTHLHVHDCVMATGNKETQGVTSVHFADFGRPEKLIIGWTYGVEDRQNLGPEGIRRVLTTHMRFNKDIVDHCEKFYADNDLGNAFAVHIRATDYPKEEQYGPESFMEAIRISQVGLKTCFLCTDSLEVEKRFRELFKGRVVVHPKWFPADGSSLHNTNENPNGLREAVTDLYLMARCPVFIRGGSSISYIAGLLARPGSRCITLGNVRIIR